MKKYGYFAYTFIFKITIFILITVFTWESGEQIIKLFSFHIENPTAFSNVFIQGEDFDYETSEYAVKDIRNTVDSVMEYSLKYMRDYNPEENGSKETFDYYMKKSNEKYKMTADYLESLKGVTFAVVNHNTDKIVSDIQEIDGKSSGLEIRSLFRNEKGRFLIIRSCKNPYFEQDTMTEYVDYIRREAENYNDNFDLYINFGDNIPFVNDTAYYENLHSETLDYVTREMNIFIFFSLIVILSILIFFTVTGKAEKNGKMMPSITDPIPNDLLFVFLFIIAGSASALFYNSLYMLYRSATIESYGLGFSPEFYAFKTNVCLVVFVWIFCACICKLRRQRKLGTLTSNTYIYKGLTLLKSSKNASNNQNT